MAVDEWSGVYYLSGYVLESGLKSCFVRQFRANTMPDRVTVNAGHTHKLDALVKLSDLDRHLDAEIAADPVFLTNWLVAKDWTEASRYDIWSETDARDLLEAVSNRRHGVFRWVRKHW